MKCNWANRVLTLSSILLMLMLSTTESAGQAEDSVQEVSVGLYLVDLVDISGSSQSFLADVVMVARWHDPSLIGAYEQTIFVDANEVWHPQLLIVNQREVKLSLPETVKVEPDGNVQYMQRFTGTFSAVLNLHSFPLDRQRLNVWVAASDLLDRNVNLMVDNSMVTYRNDKISIIDWHLGDLLMTSRPFTATSNAIPAPGVELSIEVKRRFGYYVIQVIIPLVAIMLMAWAVFWIPPPTTNVRVGVVVTTMLTLIAYRFALANHVPRLSYLTRLDWFLLGATGLVMLALGAMAFSAYLVNEGKEDQVAKMDWYGRIVYPALVVGFTCVVWLL